MDWFSSNLTFNAVSAILVDLSDLSTNSVNLTYPRSSQQAGMHDTHSLSGVLGVFIELTQNDSTRVEYSPVVMTRVCFESNTGFTDKSLCLWFVLRRIDTIRLYSVVNCF